MNQWGKAFRGAPDYLKTVCVDYSIICAHFLSLKSTYDLIMLFLYTVANYKKRHYVTC